MDASVPQRDLPMCGRPNSKRVRRAIPKAAYMLSGPAAFLMFVLILGPAASVLVMAFTNWVFGTVHIDFVGLANFEALVRDAYFRSALLNTLLYVAVVVPATGIGGLMIALLIEGHTSLRGFYRAVHFLPFMATVTVMALAWEALLHPTVGIVNYALHSLGFSAPNWLRNRHLVLPVLMVIGTWQHLGYAMVLCLAGIKAIPQDRYEAAAIDGADGILDKFFYVTLPSLGPVLIFLTFIIAQKAFRVFETVRVLTQGGPGSASETLLDTIYLDSFVYLKTGYGAAVTVVFLVILLSLTYLQRAVLEKKVHY
jgi:multiple sugar transport system permease protein